MRLLPILKSASWDDPSRGAFAHLWIPPSDGSAVYIGYGWEDGDGLVFATRETHADQESDEIVRQAFDNLEQCRTEFELVTSNETSVVVCAGSRFAAEQVLSERFMRRIHNALDADEIVVSVSRRGSLLACARDCPREAKRTMTDLHLESWRSSTVEDRITDRLIVFADARKTVTIAIDSSGDDDNRFEAWG